MSAADMLPLELPYPPGTPEFEEWAAEDKGPMTLGLCWAFTALAIIFVIARLYTRLSLFRQLKSDDYWCLASLICAILASIFTTIAVDYGSGQHYQLLSIHQQTEARRYNIAAFPPGAMSFVLPKFAVVALLTRLLNPSKLHRMFLWGICIVLFLSLLGAFGILFEQCDPREGLWDMTLIFEMECIDPRIYVDYSIYCGAISAFVDFYLAIYPGLVLWKLQMKLQKKIALTFALSLGVIGGAFAIYKTYRMPQGLENPDFSYETADLITWTIVEGSAIIIAATIPVLSPLMDKVLKQYNPFKSTGKSSRRSYLKGRKGYHGHSASAQSGTKEMDERAPRHAPRDPYDLDTDLAQTIVDPSEEELPSSKKKQPDDLEAQHENVNSRLSQSSSGSTQIGDADSILGRMPSNASLDGRIVRTSEFTLSVDQERQPVDAMAELDRNIPWETQVSPTVAAPRHSNNWPRLSRDR